MSWFTTHNFTDSATAAEFTCIGLQPRQGGVGTDWLQLHL